MTPLRKFLLVDDYAGFRRTLRAFLPEGEVVECDDGDKALAYYSAMQPDWVLMDIDMPGLNGLSATRLLRERFPRARIIVVTRHSGEEIRILARALGACGFVAKEQLNELRPLLVALEPGGAPAFPVC